MQGGATQAYLCPADAKWADSLHRCTAFDSLSKACQYFTADSLTLLHHALDSLSRACQYATANGVAAVCSLQSRNFVGGLQFAAK